MHIFLMINALICINNYIITCINSMLSSCNIRKTEICIFLICWIMRIINKMRSHPWIIKKIIKIIDSSQIFFAIEYIKTRGEIYIKNYFYAINMSKKCVQEIPLFAEFLEFSIIVIIVKVIRVCPKYSNTSLWGLMSHQISLIRNGLQWDMV